MDPQLARAAVDPLTQWMPPALMCLLMVAFGFAWWRSLGRIEANRAEAEGARYDALAIAIKDIGATLGELRVTIASFVTVERHAAAITVLNDKINALALELARR